MIVATSPLDFLKQTVEVRRTIENVSDKWKYLCSEDFVLKHGREYTPRPLPKKIRKGEVKQCFTNTFNLMSRNPGKYTYVEGYAMGVFPVYHAWVVDKDGFVIDTTWTAKERIKGSMRAEIGTWYFGVAFDFGYVISCRYRSRHDCVLDNWKLDFELLKGLVPEEKWKHVS